MARAQTVTKLPMDRWARILGFDPRHFNQVEVSQLPIHTPASCNTVIAQWSWQSSDKIAREDIAQAIQQAEWDIEDYLNFNLLPTWIVDERRHMTQPGIPYVLNIGARDARGFAQSLGPLSGHFISGGIEAKDLIEASSPVVYTDQDGDGYRETATITAATTVTDPEQIAVYYPGEGARDEWEVRPLDNPRTHRRDVSISAGVVTIVLATEQLVDPDLLDALAVASVDGSDILNFLATVDVYRHYNDPQQQATLLWNPHGGFCGCSDGSCPACQHSTQAACLLASNFENGIVRFSPALFNATTGEFTAQSFAVGRMPDNIRLWYRAGFQDKSDRRVAPLIEMDDQMARAVTFLSIKYITRPFCGCENIVNLTKHLAEDLSINLSTEPKTTSYQLSDRILDIPFGQTRGAIQAWQIVNAGERRIGRAVAL